jgi:Rrf2 family nitric oxide-sensitive transcriptional repressor
MPIPVAAPSEADALRRLAEAMKRVHLPATLLQLLLALLAVLTGNKSVAAQLGAAVVGASVRTWRTPLRDWHFSPTGETIDDLAPVLHPRALRRLRRQRAWIGWILHGLPGRGMRPSRQRAPELRPTRSARAPPPATPAPVQHKSVSRTPPRAATTHARIVVNSVPISESPMRLLAATDFSLRLLMRLAETPTRHRSTEFLAQAIGVPRNHVHKIVQDLAEAGFVRTLRGAQGGVLLAQPAAAIRIGAVVRHLERAQSLVECFRPDGGACCLSPDCRLRAVLARAREAFLASLDSTSLEECLPPRAMQYMVGDAPA